MALSFSRIVRFLPPLRQFEGLFRGVDNQILDLFPGQFVVLFYDHNAGQNLLKTPNNATHTSVINQSQTYTLLR
jgi:hypothetical protein